MNRKDAQKPPALPDGACKMCGGGGAIATMLARVGDAQEWGTAVCAACVGTRKARATQQPPDAPAAS
jgi:hypothetical protein